MAGLRRSEVDVLPWSAFRWNEDLIRIEATKHFRPKSRDSEGDVIVDPELPEIFRGYHARRRSEFVIESDSVKFAEAKVYDRYRCQRDIVALIVWLRGKGVVSNTPLHTLRKEYGSQINARYGLTADCYPSQACSSSEFTAELSEKPKTFDIATPTTTPRPSSWMKTALSQKNDSIASSTPPSFRGWRYARCWSKPESLSTM